MNPKRAKRSIDPQKVDRKFSCSHYNNCLNKTVDLGWSGFTCVQCHDFDLEGGGEAAYWYEQEMRAARLLLEAAALCMA